MGCAQVPSSQFTPPTNRCSPLRFCSAGFGCSSTCHPPSPHHTPPPSPPTPSWHGRVQSIYSYCALMTWPRAINIQLLRSHDMAACNQYTVTTYYASKTWPWLLLRHPASAQAATLTSCLQVLSRDQTDRHLGRGIAGFVSGLVGLTCSIRSQSDRNQIAIRSRCG